MPVLRRPFGEPRGGFRGRRTGGRAGSLRSFCHMCGIAGFVSLTGRRPDPQRIAGMVATLRHRGPDDRGTFLDGPAALGAARLSIIDVAGGHQPITIEGGITVAQNGEIYNYIELRDEIAARRPRRSRPPATRRSSRTSTRCTASRGSRRCVGCSPSPSGTLRGSGWCSRAIAPARSRCTTSGMATTAVRVRDEGDSRGARSSAVGECRGAAELLHLRLRRRRAGRVRGHAAPPAGRLAARGRARGPTRETIARSGAGLPRRRPTACRRPRRSSEFAPSSPKPSGSGLRSDVPLGAFLSGGMDSAAILALMTRQSSRPVKTFTIGFGDRRLRRADGSTSHGAALRRRSSRTGRHARTASRSPNAWPITTTNRSPTRRRFRPSIVAELARRHVTVCLTGDGGDELFAGYTPYMDALARVGPAPVAAFAASSAPARAASRCTPAARDGCRRMALGPEAWFVWRRTVFPDYLLEAVVEPDVLAAAGEPARAARPSPTSAPTAVRCSRGCSSGISGTTCPMTSSSRSIARRWRIRSRRVARILDDRVIELAAAQSACAPRRRRRRPSGCFARSFAPGCRPTCSRVRSAASACRCGAGSRSR